MMVMFGMDNNDYIIFGKRFSEDYIRAVVKVVGPRVVFTHEIVTKYWYFFISPAEMFQFKKGNHALVA